MARLRDSAEVSYAVRLPVVLKYLGQLCSVSSILTCVTCIVAGISGELNAFIAYLAAALVLGACGAATRRIQAPSRLQRNEAFVIAALIFPITAVIMAVPFAVSGLSFADAFFESVSGITTTGLTTLSSVDGRSQSFLFARAWMQWYGGLGIVALSLALAPHPGVLTRRLGLVDTGGETDLIGGTRAQARRVFLVYSSITLIACAALWALGLSWFDAVTHSLAAVSTGGFSSHDLSLAAFPSFWPQLVVILTCLACSISLPAYWHLRRDGWRVVVSELQLWAFLAVAIAGTLLLSILMMRSSESVLSTIRNASLMALSAQTTAGFSTTSVVDLDPTSKLVLIIMMAVGGGTESTAGGFKVLRLLILIRVLHSLLLRTALAKHAVHQPRLGGRRLEDAVVEPALLIIILFGVVVLLSWLLFVACGFDPLNALFEVVSATGTVGLSTGICQEGLPRVLKMALCLDMLLGRVEFIALLVVLFPRTWFGKRVATS